MDGRIGAFGEIPHSHNKLFGESAGQGATLGGLVIASIFREAISSSMQGDCHVPLDNAGLAMTVQYFLGNPTCL